MPSKSGSAQTADAIVLGGGIIGCAIALRLAQARMKVIILDRGKPGAEASTAAAGMLAPQGERVEPPSFADLGVASRELYSPFVAEIEESSGQLVGYRQDGSLLVALDEEHAEELRETHQEHTKRGFRLEMLEPSEVHRRVRGLADGIRLGVFVPGDHWVDNQSLMPALVACCQRLGVSFRVGEAVTRLNAKNGRVESVETAAAGRRGDSSSPPAE